MATVASTFGHDIPREQPNAHVQVVGTNRVGIEIELENLPSVRFESRYWQVTSDGSLRNNGREFVMNGAWGGEDLFNAAIDLDSLLVKLTPDANWRCSAHCHTDMRHATAQQLKHLIIINTVFEKLLFRISGMHRYTNNFCAALGFAQRQVEHLAGIWQLTDEAFIREARHGWCKYSSMNLKPLEQYGTVEFRSSVAEWRKGKVIRLANRFLAMHELAMWWSGSEQDLINHLATLNPKQFFRQGLSRAQLPEGWEEDISVGVKLAHDLIHLGALQEHQRPQLEPSEGRPIRATRSTFQFDDMTATRRLVNHRNDPDEISFPVPRSRWGALNAVSSTRGLIISGELPRQGDDVMVSYSTIQQVISVGGFSEETILDAAPLQAFRLHRESLFEDSDDEEWFGGDDE